MKKYASFFLAMFISFSACFAFTSSVIDGHNEGYQVTSLATDSTATDEFCNIQCVDQATVFAVGVQQQLWASSSTVDSFSLNDDCLSGTIVVNESGYSFNLDCPICEAFIYPW